MSSVAYLLKLGENLLYYFEEINIFFKNADLNNIIC